MTDSSSSEPRTHRLTQVGDLLHDFRQSLEDIGEALKIPDMPSMSDFQVRDKAKEMPQLVRDWNMSYARTAAQNALSMVMSHHGNMEIWQVTRGYCKVDEDGQEQDLQAIMHSCAGYGCHVADLTSYEIPFFTRVDTPPPPAEEAEEVSDDERTTSDADISERYQGGISSESAAPSSPPAS